MADFLRRILLADDFINGEPVNEVDVTDRIEDIQVEFIVDVPLSNPHNKRYSSIYKNGMNIHDLFADMVSEVDANIWVGLSNGTKTSYHVKKVWLDTFAWNLKHFITDEKNENCNVKIEVSGKNLKADEPVKVSKL